MWPFGKRKGGRDLSQLLTPQEYERLAESHLMQKGYRISERNFRLRCGELDLIALHGSTVVFVEVRMRRDERFGSPEETVGADKQARIRKVAETYLQGRNMTRNFTARFDIVAILHKPGEQPELRHYENAF